MTIHERHDEVEPIPLVPLPGKLAQLQATHRQLRVTMRDVESRGVVVFMSQRPELFHGWPRCVLYDAGDHATRLDRVRRELPNWLASHISNDRLWAAVAANIGYERETRRRAYVRRVAGGGGVEKL